MATRKYIIDRTARMQRWNRRTQAAACTLLLSVVCTGAQNLEDAPAEEPGDSGTSAAQVDISAESFSIIAARNIFDPDRRPQSREPEPEPEPRAPEPQVDVVALTGTLSAANGTFAFFDSNSSEFRKTARIGDLIAGFKLKDIRQSEVSLEGESRAIKLEVGQQLKRVDDGEWDITADASVDGASSSPGRSSRWNSTSTTSGKTSSPEPGSDAATATESSESSEEGPSEALKRLLERRRNEQAK